MVLLRSFVISFVLVLFSLAIAQRNHDGVMASLLAKLNLSAESTRDNHNLAKQLVNPRRACAARVL